MSLVLFSLVVDIFSYDVLSVLEGGVGVEPRGPELPSPQHPLDLGALFEEFSADVALDVLNDTAGGSCGDGLDEEMDVVFISADFEKVDVEAGLYFKTDFLERLRHTIGEHVPSIFDGTDKVIDEPRLVVAARNMTFLHATNIHLIWMTSQQAARKSVLLYDHVRTFFQRKD